MHQAEIAELIKTLSTGIYGIGVHHAGEQRIFTASWVMPVSFNPILIALSVNPHHRSYQLLKQSRSFTINVIAQDHAELAEKLAGPGDRLQGLRCTEGLNGCPLLELALAHLECQVIHEYPAGDHHLIVGKLQGGSLRNPKGIPLLYAQTGNLDGAIALFPEKL
ncbi:MAG: hypothetical protein RLZZ627_366 [Pseudomonadota bacterium]